MSVSVHVNPDLDHADQLREVHHRLMCRMGCCGESFGASAPGCLLRHRSPRRRSGRVLRPPAGNVTALPLFGTTVSVLRGPKPRPLALIEMVAMPCAAMVAATLNGPPFLLSGEPGMKMTTGHPFAGRGVAGVSAGRKRLK